MASATMPPSPPLPPSHRLAPRSSPASNSFFLLPFPSPPRLLVLRASTGVQSGGLDSEDPALLRRPVATPPPLPQARDEDGEMEDDADGEERRGRAGSRRKQRKDPEWVDWEDQILADTVPLVGFVRMILHSGKYESGDRLIPEHEKAVIERLLVHHPQFEKKIGCGIDFITIGYHPDFESSRCLFIVRKDGELVDFSFWKCIKGLVRKKYPLYADGFILRHFRRRRND